MVTAPQTPAPRVRIVGTRPMPADEALNSMAYAAAEGLQGDGTMQAALWHDVLCEVLDALDTARDDTVQLAYADKMIATLTRERDAAIENAAGWREQAAETDAALASTRAERDAALAALGTLLASGYQGWRDDPNARDAMYAVPGAALLDALGAAPVPVPAAADADPVTVQ